jgi:hypothetical protein
MQRANLSAFVKFVDPLAVVAAVVDAALPHAERTTLTNRATTALATRRMRSSTEPPLTRSELRRLNRRASIALAGAEISAMTRFENTVLPWFGLPRSIPSSWSA